MSDAGENTDTQESAEAETGPLGGERLAEARRARKIPVLEIAKELHLDEYKVRALERNEFDVLGAPVFAKGHLRKYAQLVDVAVEDVMTDYYQLHRSDGAPLVVSARRRPRKEISPGPWIVAILVLLAVAAAYWWFVEREPVRPAVETGQVAPLPAGEPDETQDSAPQRVENSVEVELRDSRPEGAAPPPEVVQAEETPAAATDPDLMRLTVIYSGDCWTEITDGRGRRLFFDLGTAGRTVNLSGEAPFNVLFGDADNVSLELNGAPYTIQPANRRGKTARLTLAGS